MRIVSFYLDSDPTRAHTGALLDSEEGEPREIAIFSVQGSGIAPPANPLEWFNEDGKYLEHARAMVASANANAADRSALREAGAVVEADRVRLAAPVPRPGKLICIGLNYRDHAAESGMDIPERPLIFSKFGTCVADPEASVRIPEDCTDLDYEAEFAFVIGRLATRVKREGAMEHVLGYCCVNDVSARDFQFADGQWQRGKSCDDFAPMGPELVTRDEVADPHALRIQFRLNGETLQDSNTNQLIFGVPELVAELSRHITLEPGDVISTGTPPGVGFARKPPVWLKAGDVMEVEIDGLGILRNTVVAS